MNKLLITNGAKKKIKREIWKYFEMNENEDRTSQHLWDMAKMVLRWKLTLINTYIKKENLI